jgi:hypothetical protein
MFFIFLRFQQQQGTVVNDLLIVSLDHFAKQLVDLVFAVAEIAALNKVVGLLGPAAGRVVQLEGPEEVGGLLEVLSNGVDLVDQIFDANDVVLAEIGLDDLVVSDGDAAVVVLGETTLVDEVVDRLHVGVAPGDVGIDDAEHLQSRLVQLDEHAVVDLAQAEQLHDLAGSGVDLVDTSDADDERQLGLGRHVEVANLDRFAIEADQFALLLAVLLDVLLSPLEDSLMLLLGILGVLGLRLNSLGAQLSSQLSLLEHRLRDRRQFLSLGHFSS